MKALAFELLAATVIAFWGVWLLLCAGVIR